MGIRKIIYGLLQLGAESTATTQTTAVIQSLSGSLALVPQGVGAITAAIPDGTATGGNARGPSAVDLQIVRSINTQVSSGNNSVICGGRDNLNSSVYGFLGGGYLNKIGVYSGGNNDYAVIVGGYQNQTQGPNNYTVIVGGFGNTNSSGYGVISGGQSNTASTNTHATVVGGYSNTASGQFSVAGGTSSTASGQNSFALGNQASASGNGAVALGGQTGGGGGVTASGNYSFAFGVAGTKATQPYSVAIGYAAQSLDYGKYTYANGNSGQYSKRIVKSSAALLNSAGTIALTLNDSSQTIVFQAGSYDAAMSVTVDWVATCKIVGSGTLTRYDTIAGKDFFKISVNTQTTSLGSITRIATSSDTSMSTANMSYSLSYSGTTGYLYLTFTAPTTANGSTFHIVANVDMVEITGN